MKTMCLVLTLSLLSYSVFAQQSGAPHADSIQGVTISQSVEPMKSCQKLPEVYVSIHQPGSNQENLAQAVKASGGDFVVIRYDSPYYSYKYGGDVYKCAASARPVSQKPDPILN